MNNTMFITDAPLVLVSPSDLVPGDRIVIGKRVWLYLGRVNELYPDKNVQNEYVFESPEHDDGPGSIGPCERIYSQSEIEAFAAARFLQRQSWRAVNFDANTKVSR